MSARTKRTIQVMCSHDPSMSSYIPVVLGRRQDHVYIPYDVTNIHDPKDVDVLRQYVMYICYVCLSHALDIMLQTTNTMDALLHPHNF
jgi:hypothetical protein